MSRKNINEISIRQLCRLPGIGKKTAQKIIAARPFTNFEEVKNIPRLGNKYLVLKEHLNLIIRALSEEISRTPEKQEELDSVEEVKPKEEGTEREQQSERQQEQHKHEQQEEKSAAAAKQQERLNELTRQKQVEIKENLQQETEKLRKLQNKFKKKQQESMNIEALQRSLPRPPLLIRLTYTMVFLVACAIYMQYFQLNSKDAIVNHCENIFNEFCKFFYWLVGMGN